MICQHLSRDRCSWMQSPGVCFGKSVASSILLQGGKPIRYMFGWLTQDEEDEFDKTCNAVYNDMTGKSKSLIKLFSHQQGSLQVSQTLKLEVFV